MQLTYNITYLHPEHISQFLLSPFGAFPQQTLRSLVVPLAFQDTCSLHSIFKPHKMWVYKKATRKLLLLRGV